MPTIEIFKSDEDGQHYWRLKAKNGKIIAVGGEGYKTHAGAIKGIGSMQSAVLQLAGKRVEDFHKEDAAAHEKQEEEEGGEN